MSAQDDAATAAAVCLRATQVCVRQRGCRTRVYVVVTTLLEPAAASAAELAELYRARWHAELVW